jgi:hypothetical protein
MLRRSIVAPSVFVLVLVAMPLGAQEHKDADIPKGSKPPAGMCRVWLDNVAPAQQPAATDCATAIKNSPAGAHIVFGFKSYSKTAGIRTGEPVQGGATSRRADQAQPQVQRVEPSERKPVQAQPNPQAAAARTPPPAMRPQAVPRPVPQPTPPPVKPPGNKQY